jgi:hypothetical protein
LGKLASLIFVETRGRRPNKLMQSDHAAALALHRQRVGRCSAVSSA